MTTTKTGPSEFSAFKKATITALSGLGGMAFTLVTDTILHAASASTPNELAGATAVGTGSALVIYLRYLRKSAGCAGAGCN